MVMMMLFTRCADTSGGLPAVNGMCSPSSSFYCPSRYESAQVYEIESGECVTVIVDSDQLLFVLFGGGGGGDCDGRGSTAVLTIELISENPTRSLWVPKKSLLSKLLTRADIAHRFCVSTSGGDPCGEHGGEEEGVLWKRSSSPAASDASS
jgi:hypothetical protein